MILRELAARNRSGARLADLVSSLQLEQPTVHRMLKSLVAASLATQDPESKRYYLGQTIYELGLAASHRFDLKSLCEPVLSSLAAQTRDTSFLTVRNGDESVCLDRREGDSPIKVFTLTVGDRRPLGVGAGSMALLSGFPEAEIRRVIAVNEGRFQDFGGESATTVLAAVLEAKRRGYSIRNLPGYEGIRAIGMPVLNGDGQPVAALSISTLVGRLSGKEFEFRHQVLREHCEAISQLIKG